MEANLLLYGALKRKHKAKNSPSRVVEMTGEPVGEIFPGAGGEQGG